MDAHTRFYVQPLLRTAATATGCKYGGRRPLPSVRSLPYSKRYPFAQNCLMSGGWLTGVSILLLDAPQHPLHRILRAWVGVAAFLGVPQRPQSLERLAARTPLRGGYRLTLRSSLPHIGGLRSSPSRASEQRRSRWAGKGRRGYNQHTHTHSRRSVGLRWTLAAIEAAH